MDLLNAYLNAGQGHLNQFDVLPHRNLGEYIGKVLDNHRDELFSIVTGTFNAMYPQNYQGTNEDERLFNAYMQVFFRDFFLSSNFAANGGVCFRLGEQLSAMLLLTSTKRVCSKELNAPFDSFALKVPKGLIPMYDEAGRETSLQYMLINFLDNPEGDQADVFLIGLGVEGLAKIDVGLNFSQWDAYSHEDCFELPETRSEVQIPLVAGDQITIRAMVRLLTSFLAWYEIGSYNEHAPMVRVPETNKSKKKADRITPKFFEPSVPMKVNKHLVEGAKDVVRLGSSKLRKGWMLSVQQVVTGHHFNQAFGPGLSQRRRWWRRPHIRGGENDTMAQRSYDAAI